MNGTWHIVDPWYIGGRARSDLASQLVPVYELSSILRFSDDRQAIVMYPNGTQMNAGIEHGYKRTL